MSELEDSTDSRTASVGRKRAREGEERPTLESSPEEPETPTKRLKLAAPDLSFESAPPEPVLRSRASSSGKGPRRFVTDSEDESGIQLAEDSSSGGIELHAAQTSAQPSGAAEDGGVALAEPGEIRSDDSLLSNVIVAEKPQKKARTVPKKTSSAKTLPTRHQKELIRNFERERAKKIFADAPVKPALGTDAERRKCVTLEIASPAQLDDPDYKNRQKRSMQATLLRYLAKTISGGLETAYYCWQNAAREVVLRALLIYSNPEEAEHATAVMQTTELKVFGTVPTLPKALPVSSSESEGWSKIGNNDWKEYAEASSQLVYRKLSEGELQPEQYQGFSPGSHTAPKAQSKTNRAASSVASGSANLRGLLKGSNRDVPQPSMTDTARATQSATDRQRQNGHRVANGGVEVVDAREPDITPINGLSRTAETAINPDSLMDEAGVDGEQLWFQDTQPSAVRFDAPSARKVETPVKLFQLSPAERELQGRYWRIFNGDETVRCMTCAAEGHMSEACPSRICKHCQVVDDHFSSACPAVRKCIKCRERGHSETDCPFKLKRGSAGGLLCDLCHESDHSEENCCWLWRTFDVKAVQDSKKVDSLLVGCYNCGSNRHWGNDCPLHGVNKRFDVPTFSAMEANNFILSSNRNPTIGNSKRNMGISIRGRANHDAITISDDDEEPTTFLGKKVRQPPSRGKIRVNAPAQRQFSNADRYQITPNDYDRRPIYDHPPPPSFHTRPRSRSPPRRDYDSYQGRYDDRQGGGYRARSPLGNSYNRGQSWQPPLPNEPVPPPRRDRYDSYDRGYQPPLPNEPPPPPRRALGSGGRGRGRGRGRR